MPFSRFSISWAAWIDTKANCFSVASISALNTPTIRKALDAISWFRSCDMTTSL